MKIKILFIFLITTTLTYGQVNISDTSVTLNHAKTYYVPRVSLSYQKSMLLEAGICRQWSKRFSGYSKIKGWDPHYEVCYVGAYLSGEAILNKDNWIYGIKLGIEPILIGATSGILGGIEVTDYIYRTRHYAAITPKIMIPLTRRVTPLAFISYGYCINDFESLSTLIGNHRISLIVNLCIKEHREISKMGKDFDDAVKIIKK